MPTPESSKLTGLMVSAVSAVSTPGWPPHNHLIVCSTDPRGGAHVCRWQRQPAGRRMSLQSPEAASPARDGALGMWG
jgi:hypothetical protein